VTPSSSSSSGGGGVTGNISGGSGTGSNVDEEMKRVQAECRHLSTEIQRLQEDNSKLRVSYSLAITLINVWLMHAGFSLSVLTAIFPG